MGIASEDVWTEESEEGPAMDGLELSESELRDLREEMLQLQESRLLLRKSLKTRFEAWSIQHKGGDPNAAVGGSARPHTSAGDRADGSGEYVVSVATPHRTSHRKACVGHSDAFESTRS